MSEPSETRSTNGLRVQLRRSRLVSTSSNSSSEEMTVIKRKRRRTKSPSEEDENYSKRQRSSTILDDLINALNVKNKSSISSHQMLNALPEFDPENRSQNIEMWLHKINEYAHIYNWDDRQISHFATQKLVGTAKNWLYSLPSLNFTWVEWQTKLRRAFPAEDNFAIILEEMFMRKTKPDESLRIYFYDKLMLLNRCGITGKKAVDCLIHGITDISLRNSAQALKCLEPEDLLKYLVIQQPQSKIQSTSQLVQNLQQRSKIKCYFCGVEGHTSNRCFRIKKEKPKLTSSTVPNMKCFNCNEEGHRFVNCPKVILKCNVCKKVGHSAEKCNRYPSSNINDTVKFEKVLNIESNDSNVKFNKNIEINNKTSRAYIDFGSDCSLIQFTEAKKLNLPNISCKLPFIKGFGNSYVSPLYKTEAKVAIDEVETTIFLYVVEDRYLHVPILIGQNFSELDNVVVMKDCSTLTFYSKPLIEGEPDTIKLITNTDTELKGIHLIPVHCTYEFTGDIYIEPLVRNIPGKEYCLKQGIYSIKEGKGEILVSNMSNKPFTLKSNTTLCRALRFQEVELYNVRKIENSSKELPPLKKEDIQVGSDVDTETLDKLYNLLQNYRDCFACALNEIGCAPSKFEMKIELTDNKPIVYRPYRLSHSERQKVRDTVAELMSNDIIRESESDYASPILMVKKKTGEQRLCVDFRALNAKTVKNRYPLPLIDDQISNLSGNKYFTTLDMASGYYQIPLSEDSKHLTAFVTPDGHYEFNRMPFGLANAPAVFQKVVNKMLGSKRFDSVLAYMDDLLIPTKSVKEGFDKLEQVLKLVREYGLTLKLSKCCFFSKTIDYLGYEVSSEGIKPGKRKIIAIEQFPTPTNIHKVRQFLGLTGFFRKFIKDYGVIARPLNNLLKKDVEWCWTDVEDRAFSDLKIALSSRPVLALYNPNFKTELHTDASSAGIGGILMQWQENSKELKPVAYFSRQTTPEEKYYHSYELETLAVHDSLLKFRTYLLGIHFKIYTDCKALRLTLSKKDLLPKVARWLLVMEEYDYDMEYRPGDRMAHADALSRNPVENYQNTCILDKVMTVSHIEQSDWLVSLQLGDPEINRISKILKPDIDEEFLDIKKHYTLKNNILYRKINGDTNDLRLVIPKGARWQICRLYHDEGGHFGHKKTLDSIQSKYWFPKMSRFLKKYIDACIECAFNKDNAPAKQGHIYPIEKVSTPFQTIHIDHLGPFIKSKRGNAYILTVVDGFSKYVFVRPVKDTKSSSAIKALQNIFQDFGTPQRIISDRGTAFTSAQFKQFCAERNIKHILNAVSCPRANGQVERFNQTVLKALATQNSNKNEKDWDLTAAKVQFSINNTINSTTGKTASEILFGIRMMGNVDNVFREALNEVVDGKTDIDQIRTEAKDTIDDKQKKMKIQHDSKTVPAKEYKLNDLVKITKVAYNDNPGQSKKLLPKFIGPYKITKVLGNDRYEISNVPGFSKTKKYVTVVAADRMRPWINVKALNVMSDDDSTESESS